MIQNGDNLVERIINIIVLFESISFFYVIFRREFRENNNKLKIEVVIWVLLWGIPGIILGFGWQKALIAPVPVFLPMFIILTLILFKIRVGEAVLIGTFTWLIISLIESIIVIAMSKTYVHGDSLYAGIISLFVTGIIWIIYFFRKDKHNHNAFRLSNKVWVILDLMMFSLMAMISFYKYIIMNNIIEGSMNTVGQWLLVLSGILVVVLLFAFVYSHSSSCDLRIQNEIKEMQMTQQRDYFEQVLKKEEETRRFRHDVANDLLVLREYCKKEDYQKVNEYLEKVTGAFKNINRQYYDVGNNIVNSIINYYLNSAECNFETEVHGYMKEATSLNERALCIVCGNMIKNAAEAAEKSSKGKVWVNVSSGKDYMSIQVKNTYDGTINFDRNGIPYTSKEDKKNHGIGISNILDAIKKNGGQYKMDTNDGIFEAEAFIRIGNENLSA